MMDLSDKLQSEQQQVSLAAARDPRLYRYFGQLVWEWRRRGEHFMNPHMGNEPWYCLEVDWVSIGFDAVFMAREDMYYDAFKSRSWTFAWVRLAYGHSPVSQSLSSWIEQQRKQASNNQDATRKEA